MDSLQLDYKILVGTHHKAGTAWMQSIFSAICRQFSLKFCNSSKTIPPEPDFDVLLNYHSAFDQNVLSLPYRGLHLIRDPRDIIVSGCFYHQRSSEEWLHLPMERLGGKTYCDSITSLPSLDEKLLFEMGFSAKTTITDMLKWDYFNKSFYEVKYETIINDTDFSVFHEIFQFLGFPGHVLHHLYHITRNNSLIIGQPTKSSHIRSGKPGQWKEFFKPIHKERFLELFGDALIQLGYEKNNDWNTFESE